MIRTYIFKAERSVYASATTFKNDQHHAARIPLHFIELLGVVEKSESDSSNRHRTEVSEQELEQARSGEGDSFGGK